MVAKAEFHRQTQVAEFESKAAGEKRQLELQKDVEECRSRQILEHLRALEVTAANVKAEIEVRIAEGHATALKTEATAKAEVTKLQAHADSEAIKMKAHANYVQAENEAKAILKLREAEAEGLTKLIHSAGGVQNLSQYLIVRDGVLVQLAEQYAKSLHDMKPNVNVWQTGSKDDGVSGLSGTVGDLLRNGMPLLDGIKQQTGIDFLKSFRSKEPIAHA
jgi:uncharacterized membrane protein YqiK